MGEANRAGQAPSGGSKMPLSVKLKFGALLVLAVLAVVLIVENWVGVPFDLIIWKKPDMPLSLLIVAFLAIGFVGHFLVSTYARSRRNKS